jgi:hypothetical protein
MNTFLLLVVIGLQLLRFRIDYKWRKKMADDLSGLEQVIGDAETAIDNADADINKLIAQIGATPPSQQAKIDELKGRLQVKIAALIAATNQTVPGTNPTARSNP